MEKRNKILNKEKERKKEIIDLEKEKVRQGFRLIDKNIITVNNHE